MTDATGGDGTAMARVLIVDDHLIFRQGLRAILQREPSVSIVGEASGPDDALAAVDALDPDVVLLDLRLASGGEDSGLDLCRTLTQREHAPRVLVLSTFVNQRLVVGAIRAGAQGYVLKDVDTRRLVEAIGAVSRGESAFDSHAAAFVVRTLAAEEPEDDGSGSLSRREQEVLALVGRGLSNQEIGTQLFISTTTVKFHLRNIMRKLEVHRRAELAFRAGRLERSES